MSNRRRLDVRICSVTTGDRVPTWCDLRGDVEVVGAGELQESVDVRP